MAGMRGESVKVAADQAGISPTRASRVTLSMGNSDFARSIPAAALLCALVLFLGSSQLLLLGFLGLASPALVLFQCALLIAFCASIVRTVTVTVPATRLALCWLLAALVLLLGGEGHLFYANIDWQVRDAVLSDLVRWPWPYAYSIEGSLKVLRAPVGMYLVPAVVGKALGIDVANIALLIQNSAIVGLLLALGSTLFQTMRGRCIALGVVLAFSGMDTIGAWLVDRNSLWPFERSIENWSRMQYSSTITLAFWVPHHAISGWTGAVLFLLWQRRIIPLGAFLGTVPLCVLWSPLGVMGTMPFAMLAFVQAAKQGTLRWRDLLLPTAATILVLPSLAYLAADAGRVGIRLWTIPPLVYLLFVAVEVAAVLLYVVASGGSRSVDKATLAVVAGCLALCPFVAIGEYFDFVMRASIPALLTLALVTAQCIATSGPSPWRTMVLFALAIGALTPAREVYRAFIYRSSPPGRCDVAAAWHESFSNFDKSTYFTRLAAMPALIRPVSFDIAMPSTTPCYARPWKMLIAPRSAVARIERPPTGS